MSESRSYNADNTLASLSYTEASIGTFAYSWDENKNKTAESITGTMSDFGFTVPSSGYDDEARLVGWNRDDSALDQSWNLSLVGDWDSFNENTTTQNRTHGDAHEILTVASQAVEHDVKGNMTLLPGVLRSGGDPLTIAWDFENKLASADVDDDQTDDIAYKWDALGRRIGRTYYFPLPPGEGQGEGSQTVIYFQSGQQTIADYPAGTAAASPTYTYVYASYIDEPVLRKGSGGDRYLHRNQQYSITALTDSNGSMTERYAYTAYGELEILNAAGQPKTGATDENRYTYTGREWDVGLGFYHFRARVYDPAAVRFLLRDPRRYLDSRNLFVFCKNQSLIRLDPAGTTSYHYSWFDLLRCRVKLDIQSLGTLAGMDCSWDLLDLAMNGDPQPGQEYCPQGCRNESLENAIADGCMYRHGGRGARCSEGSQTQTSSHNLSLHGTHYYENGDLYYAIKRTSKGWKADLKCTSYCKGRNRCIGHCCNCLTTCRGKIAVSDRYDFCGTTYGGKFSLTNCACALERGGLIKQVARNHPVELQSISHWQSQGHAEERALPGRYRVRPSREREGRRF